MLHLVQTTGAVGWTAGAMTGDSAQDNRIAIGPSSVAEACRAFTIPFTGILTAPLGIERLLARRLRAWVIRHGTCPKKIIAYGPAVGELAHVALPSVDRTVYGEPPEDARMNCARTAVEHWRRFDASQRAIVRQALGISAKSLVILSGGDRADSIDTREAFAAVGRSVLGGADVVLIIPAQGRWTSQTRRHARHSGMSDRLVIVDGAEIPSATWLAADVMLLKQPWDESCGPWWGWCAWWAMAAGIGVIHESCLADCDGTLAFTRRNRDELVRLLIKLADDCAGGGDIVQALSDGAIRSAQTAAVNR